MQVEKVMATHSSTLAWKILWIEEPGRLQSMGSQRDRHGWVTSLSLFTFMHWWGKWQPTPVFLPGESQWWQSLVGCRLWGRRESDTTEERLSSSSSFASFPGGSDVKESAKNSGDLRSMPGLGRSPGGGHSTHSSILAWSIPMDRGAWQAIVHRVTKSQTRLSD